MEANDLNKPDEITDGLQSENTSENTPIDQAEETTAAKEITEQPATNAPAAEADDPEDSDDDETTSSHVEEPTDEKHPEDEDDDEATEEVVKLDLEAVDHIMLSKEQLAKRLHEVLRNYPVEHIKEEVEAIKSAFYKKHTAEVDDLKRKFIESGEAEENFTPPIDALEESFKSDLNEFKDRRAEFNRKLEDEKTTNYQAKLDVIEALKDLINGQESLNDTFHAFRELQNKWRSIGIIPQNKVHDLWETYNIHVENFYNYIKINKELRDLDLKKNQEAKTELCEKAEKLILEPTIVKAFKTLQKLHEEWREIGPVPHEIKEDLWNRFKEATTLINKRHQSYFENLKDQLQKNLDAKTELCEKAEALDFSNLHSPKDWEKKSKELIDLQNIWKTIGFAPKKDNNRIYDRFRTACDAFFNAKRDFFRSYKSEQQANLQLKTDLCVQAEAMKDSTDWKHTTDQFIKIQRRWKEIGPVPRKQSDAIWKRFRSACDAFFDHKSKHFSKKDASQEKNLELKEALIKEVAEWQASDNSEENFKTLQQFQHRWNDIGHVPIKEKDRVNGEFRNLINQYFDNLNLDEYQKNVAKFRNKIENYKSNDSSGDRLTVERNKIINKLKQLEADITVWENNIGFFAKSKKSDALIRDFQNKIETGRRNIKLLNKKLDMLEDNIDM